MLNGSETVRLRDTKDNVVIFEIDGFTTTPNGVLNNIICTHLNWIPNSNWNEDVEGILSMNNGAIKFHVLKSKLPTQDVAGFKTWLQTNNVTVVYQLAQEEVYECTNLDLITYQNETNLIVNSGVIQPKLELKVLSNISNVVKLLQEKVSILENKFMTGLKQVLAGDMMSLAHMLYPEDFEYDKFEVKTLEEL